MECTNHAGVAAIGRCAGCAEPFCGSCLVPIRGKYYCGSCKVMALQGQPMAEAVALPCKEAGDSLKYAIIGFFCFGIILGPIAISKALKARKMIAMNPQLTGSGKATAGLVLGIVVCVLWLLGIIARFATLSQNSSY
jgi:hypothetical protein